MTTFTNWNVRGLNRKTWQMMTPAFANTAAGSFVVTDRRWEKWNCLLVTNATVHYGYSCEEDGWVQIPSMALAGVFWAWACGVHQRWSNTYTANWGSTTTVTTTANLSSLANGATIWILTWNAANVWKRVTVTEIISIPGGTNTLTFTPALTNAVVNTDTFCLDTWRFFIQNAYATLAAWVFKSFDVATGTVTSLQTTGLPAAWWTDGKLVAASSSSWAFGSGTATAGAATTITNSARTWTTNQWTNYQIRITGWTGSGQIRTIASNTGTVITVTSAWTTNPDATSTYDIEWNDDFIYLLGNNAITMYRYSISANTWTTLAPWAARAAAPGLWMGANWVWRANDTTWANESSIYNGRYIYSFQGWATSNLHRYDIALNTWATITYNYQQETFTTGSSFDVLHDKIFMRQNATNRFFQFDVVWGNIFPFNTLLYPDGAAVLWDKVWTYSVTDDNGNAIDFLYSLQNTGALLTRCMVF